MRTIKELLILLREYFPTSDLKERGALCFALYDMSCQQIITHDEYLTAKNHIRLFRDPNSDTWPYLFPCGELQPRLEFLDKLIAEL